MKKSIATLLALAALLVFSGCDATGLDNNGSISRNAGQPAVKLTHALTSFKAYPVDTATYYTMVAGWTEGYIEVENIAYNKEVIVHYSMGGAAWTNTRAEFVTSLGNNREIWKFKTAEAVYLPRWGGANYDFAIEYKVNGNSFWDNNGGGNYLVSCGGVLVSRPQQVLGSSALYTEGFTVTQTQIDQYTAKKVLSGTIVLKNLAYQKLVKVRYSTDNWASWKEADAVYSAGITTPNGSATGLERWSFSEEIPSSATQVKFAVSYTVNGVTYWDNNFGRDYSSAQ